MNQVEYIRHWNYFCSLTTRLQETMNYVYHGIERDSNGAHRLIHANVYSDSFKQIILLAAAEFEILARTICESKGYLVNNIVDISRFILKEYPQIIKTEIMTLFWSSMPLADWTVGKDNKVLGLDWWGAYNSLKHNEKDSYTVATLENATMSLASLFVINLYLMYIQFENLSISRGYPCDYYKCKYTSNNVVTNDGLLPDFGNKSSDERLNELISEIKSNIGNENDSKIKDGNEGVEN